MGQEGKPCPHHPGLRLLEAPLPSLHPAVPIFEYHGRPVHHLSRLLVQLRDAFRPTHLLQPLVLLNHGVEPLVLRVQVPNLIHAALLRREHPRLCSDRSGPPKRHQDDDQAANDYRPEKRRVRLNSERTPAGNHASDKESAVATA